MSVCEGTPVQKPGLPLTPYNTRPVSTQSHAPKRQQCWDRERPPGGKASPSCQLGNRRRARTPALGRRPLGRRPPGSLAAGPCPAERLPSLGSESPDRVRSSRITSQETECKVRKPESAGTYSPKHLDLFGLLNWSTGGLLYWPPPTAGIPSGSRRSPVFTGRRRHGPDQQPACASGELSLPATVLLNAP